ncbi:MAG: hypothetical protein OEW05_06285 [Candidatus Aminicenantes bacterium]|nr:hypothetical protein [Candidatus Aminicenantes bacterium]
MKLANRTQVEALTKFKPEGLWTTSLFLDTDKSRQTSKEIALSLKTMVQTGQARVASLNLDKEKQLSLSRDLDRITAFGAQKLGTVSTPGLAIFVSSGRGFWEVFELPHGPRNRLLFEKTFYVRPLSSILDRFRRIGVFLVSRREAKWYEVLMGKITSLGNLLSDVPARVREGGYKGYESKNIERHIEAHLHDHLKKAAQTTFELFKKNPFDWLLIGGGEDDIHQDLKPLLHTYLKDRLKGRLKAKPGDSASKVLKEVLALEEGLRKAEEDEVVTRFTGELERGGLATAGLKDTLQHLNVFDVQSLIVSHNFAREGHICPSCHFLYVSETVCPVDQKKTETVSDIVDEAIQTALGRNLPVRHVTPPSRLDHYGKIGAFLKYKV